MAKAFARGRPIALLMLSAQERVYLERQVRGQRVARSLSERCRVILRCADGLPSKSVAAELGECPIKCVRALHGGLIVIG
jgi:hypothetical protein